MKNEMITYSKLTEEAVESLNETGKTPRQLADDNKVLLEALKELTYQLTGEQEAEYELEKSLGITLTMRVMQAKQAIKQVTE